ncbi:hypothetical protein VTK26DRAFT_677 [Humicola hyalothermophila]
MAHGSHGGGGSGGDANPACKIDMLWNWHTIDACFLASSWHVTSHGAFAASCIGVVLLVVALEALRRLGKEYDAHIQRDFAARIALLAAAGGGGGGGGGGSSSSTSAAGGCGPCPDTTGEALAPQVVTFRAAPLQQLVRAVLHAATFGVAYIVMLLAMSYNGYIIFCILIGALLGKFLCDWMTKTVVVGGGSGVPGSGGGVVVGKGSTANGNNNGAVTGIEEPSVCCG